MVKIISIEGNIGVGKSTLIKKVMENFTENSNVVFCMEDLSLWNSIKDPEGKNIFELYYKNPKEYSFPFEITTLISRLKQLKEVEKDKLVIVTERCLDTDRDVFAKMLYNQNKISDLNYQIYNLLFDTVNEYSDITHFYIKINPEIAYERAVKRNRPNELVDLNFLKECHEYHEEWLNKKDNVIIAEELDTESLSIKLNYIIIHLNLNQSK